ncbi:DUF6942 family protein [Thalassolituus sp. LLYu03]|uniref:DUF6942 family protein n=1 Tax=Thalassolituus sp. LLYu03 TaxID=3421656 RepID=UPI003D26848E
MIGLGNAGAGFQVYIENRPPLPQYQNLTELRAMQPGEIAAIAQETGNHWRKIFNVYAKLVFAVNPAGFSRWQDLRDQQLLQQGSGQALLFSPPDVSVKTAGDTQSGSGQPGTVRLLLARKYADALGLTVDEVKVSHSSGRGDWAGEEGRSWRWLDADFAVHKASGLILCPYFDYRQLSDVRIQRLVSWLKRA